MAGEIGAAYTMLKDVTTLIAGWKKKNDKDWYIDQLEEKLNSLAREYDKLNDKYEKLLKIENFKLQDIHIDILDLIYYNNGIIEDEYKKEIKGKDVALDIDIALHELIDYKYVLRERKLINNYVNKYVYVINRARETEILKIIKHNK